MSCEVEVSPSQTNRRRDRFQCLQIEPIGLEPLQKGSWGSWGRWGSWGSWLHSVPVERWLVARSTVGTRSPLGTYRSRGQRLLKGSWETWGSWLGDLAAFTPAGYLGSGRFRLGAASTSDPPPDRMPRTPPTAPTAPTPLDGFISLHEFHSRDPNAV